MSTSRDGRIVDSCYLIARTVVKYTGDVALVSLIAWRSSVTALVN